MPFDRQDTLKKAEKLLRQGRLDAAIVEYVRVLEEQPRDWAITNTLGDLYVRAGQHDKAAMQYSRIADHFKAEGFYSKAAALYKKLLKLNPQDETSQLSLAEVSHKQGLLADAKSHLNAVAARRRERGDRAGEASIVVQLGSIDPADIDARRGAARMLHEMGDAAGAAARFLGIYTDLLAKDRKTDALEILREAVRLNPDDPELLTALLEVEVRSGRLDQVRQLLARLPGIGRDRGQTILALARTTVEADPDTAYLLVEAVADAVAGERDYESAAKMVEEFVAQAPDHTLALVKLIEICVDGGLEETMYHAQGRLADAYLKSGRASEARLVAEDLVAREPWERAHIDRFRRALVMLKVRDPDTVIADRLSGQTPFITNDLFGNVPGEPLDSATENLSATDAEYGTTRTESAPEPKSGSVHLDASERAPDQAREKLEQAFAEIRTDTERQSAADYSAQHMTLARMYLERGMADEAVGSLEIASRVPHFRFEAAVLLGRIHGERGNSDRAIDWFERAAEAPPPSVEEGRAVLYDLATLLETSGETSRALAIFLELQPDAGEYRDTADRIERLMRVERASAASEGVEGAGPPPPQSGFGEVAPKPDSKTARAKADGAKPVGQETTRVEAGG